MYCPYLVSMYSTPRASKVQHLFGIAVGLFPAGVGLFSATVGLRKSPPPAKKVLLRSKKVLLWPKKVLLRSKKSPTLTQKNPTLIKKILLEKSPPLTKKSLTSMRKSPVAHTRNILRSSEYIFTHVLLDFGIFWKPGWFGRLPISLLLAASRVPTAPPEWNFSTNFDSESGKETLLPPMYNTWIIFHFWGVE